VVSAGGESESRRARFAVWLLLPLALMSCSAQRGSKPSATPEGRHQFMTEQDEARLQAVATARSSERGGAGYRIGPDDLLQIHVPDLVSEVDRPMHMQRTAGDSVIPPLSGSPEFQEGARVDGNGDITMPLIGAVHAQGRTPRELEQDIAHRLVAAGILRDPQVSVSVAEHRSGVVAVVGSVEHPGYFPVTRPGATLSEMIWTAGGPNKDAGRIVEFVPAAEASDRDAEATPIRIDLDGLLARRTQSVHVVDPPARPGDTINIAPAGTVQVQGWVEKPGSYPITRKLTLSGAIAAAGGLQFPANRTHTTLRRMRGSQEETFVVDLAAVTRGEATDLVVADGDVVDVPTSAVKVVPWGVWKAVKELVYVGGSVALF
jgi:polysaccharide export outer membrane protein